MKSPKKKVPLLANKKSEIVPLLTKKNPNLKTRIKSTKVANNSHHRNIFFFMVYDKSHLSANTDINIHT